MILPNLCPQSTSGIHDEGSRRDGRCTWCGQRFTGKVPRPRLVPGRPSALEEAYDYAYDPDWGGRR